MLDERDFIVVNIYKQVFRKLTYMFSCNLSLVVAVFRSCNYKVSYTRNTYKTHNHHILSKHNNKK